MEISSTKSMVVASRPLEAKKVHARMVSKKAAPVRQAKLLGTSSGGGKKMSLKLLFNRMGKFRAGFLGCIYTETKHLRPPVL